MRRTVSMLAGLIALVLSACASIHSLMPVGDEPVYVEPAEWEGLWVHEPSDNGTSAFASVMVVDAAGGILEVCDPDSYDEPLRVVVRQHTTAGKQARFVSVFDDGWGYVWGRYQRILQNALVIWSPNHEEFARLVQDGLLAGQYLDEEGLIIEPLSGEQLDLITRDDGGHLYNYRFEYEKGVEELSFLDAVWFRVSPSPTKQVKPCLSRSEPDGAVPNNKISAGPAPVYRTTEYYAVISVLHPVESAGHSQGVYADEHLLFPYSISNFGQIAGVGNIDPKLGAHALLWDPDSGITDLGTLGGGYSYAASMNGHRQVVGGSQTADRQTHAFFWDAGVMIDLGAPGGDSSEAWSINNSGQVVGRIQGKAETGGWLSKAFLWTCSEGMVELGTLGGKESRASAINDQGEVVGTAKTSQGYDRAFKWHPDTGMVELGTLGGISSEASAINEKGEVVGNAKTPQGYNRAFKWHPDTGMVDLGTLGGRDGSAKAINNAGQVVGSSEVVWGDRWEERAFLWDNGRMIDLSSLPEVKAAGWSELTEAMGINDHGQIVGYGIRAGELRNFLLTPEPPLANGR
jgi:probable HAF family extracellular repeat protein